MVILLRVDVERRDEMRKGCQTGDDDSKVVSRK
jgi:hypothetical protein